MIIAMGIIIDIQHEKLFLFLLFPPSSFSLIFSFHFFAGLRGGGKERRNKLVICSGRLQ
jgi:hypothetical protein